MTRTPFPHGTEQLLRLGALVSAHAEATRRIRELEAERIRLLAEMAALAASESDRIREAETAERRVPESALAEMAMRSVAAEIAFATGVTDRTAVNDLGLAMHLETDYASLVAELSAGRTSVSHLRAVADEGGIIADRAARRAYAEEMREVATAETANRTRRIAKVIAAKHVPEPEERERSAARLRVRVEITDLEHGLSELRAVMASIEAHAIADRLTRQARSVQQRELAARRVACRRGSDAPTANTASSDPSAIRQRTTIPPPPVRPLDQIRVSLLSDMLLNAGPSNDTGDVDLSGITARIQVTVPVLGLLPEDQRPTTTTGIAGLQGAAVLAGCGPIDSETARFFASLEAGWDAVACDPRTGEVLLTDRYRPTEALRRYIFARDQHCRYPGCLVVPHRADIDHAHDAALGGTTSSDNLEVLCRYHHVLKHNTGIEMEHLPGGAIRWRSPLGVGVLDRPPSPVMFRPIDDDGPERGADDAFQRTHRPGSRRARAQQAQAQQARARCTDPRGAERRDPESRDPESRGFEPRYSESRLTESRLTESRLTGSGYAEPECNESWPAGPHMQSSHPF